MKSIIEEQNDRILAMQRVIKELRHTDLNDGHCFMIFDEELAENQAYYEYPDGRIQVEQIDENNIDVARVIISVLTDQEVAALKEKHEVFR